MNKPKIGTFLFAMTLLIIVVADRGICQTIKAGQPMPPYIDIAVGSPAYYTYDNNTHILSVTNEVHVGSNVGGTYTPKAGWFLSVDHSIATSDNLIGFQYAYLYIGAVPIFADTLTLTVDLDTVTGLSMVDGAIYYVGTIANYDRSITEVAPDSASYSTLYTNNIWGSYDPLVFGNDTLHPTIKYSTPDSGATNVALNAQVKIAFSEPMDTVSFAFAMMPNPGGLGVTWNKWRDTVSLAHAAFSYATEETITISYAQDLSGNLLSGRSVITFTTAPTGVNGRPETQNFSLKLNSAFPNPMTGGRTAIRFSLPSQTDVKLEAFNVLGQKVATLVDGRLEEGYHTISWDGTGKNGQKLPSGVYVYQLKALGRSLIKRMTLIR